MKTLGLALIAMVFLMGCSDDHNSGSNGGGDDFVGVPQECKGELCTEGYVLYSNLNAEAQWSCSDPGIQTSTCYCANPETQRIGVNTEESFPITNGVGVQGPITMTIPSLTAGTLEVSQITLTLPTTPPTSETCVPVSGATVNYTRSQSSP